MTGDSRRVYLIGGVRVALDTAGDGLFDPVDGDQADIEVHRVGELPAVEPEVNDAVTTENLTISRLADGARRIERPGWFEAVVDASGREVLIHEYAPQPHVTRMILGSIVPLMLGLHGRVAIHASAVERDGRAVVFAGPPGSGKSTLAAACVRTGARLLTDDVAVVRLDGDRVVAEPSPSANRLHPEVAARFGQAVEDPLAVKHLVRQPDSHQPVAPAPVGRFVNLAHGSDPAPTPLNGAEAALAVLEHVFPELDPDPGAREMKLTLAAAIVDVAEVLRHRWQPSFDAATRLAATVCS